MAPNLFDDASTKRKELLRIFDTLNETTIYGVVGANGPSGGKVPPETHWSMHLKLIAWRIPGTPIREVPLSVTKLVTDTELKDLQAAIRPESVIAIRGKLCEQSPFGDSRAFLIDLLEPPSDAELDEILSEFRKPVEIADPILGKLSLNRAVGWFEGKANWLKHPIDISLIVDKKDDVSESLQTAKALLGEMKRWADQANSYAADMLLENKNDNWLDEGESPVTREEFIGRMRLESITTYPEGEFELWHNDGELFWGHSILVSGSLSKGITGVDTPG